MKNIFNFNSEDDSKDEDSEELSGSLLDELLDMMFPDEDDRDAYENDV